MSMQTKVTGVVLAGGLARRMQGQDKGLVLFRGRPLVSYAIAEMMKVADQTLINANRNIAEYQQFGFPVISDQVQDYSGPLAGILSAMHFAKAGVLLVMPCDAPFFSADCLQKLLDALLKEQADIAVAADSSRLHPVFLAVKANLKNSLESYLAQGHRKVVGWLHAHHTTEVLFDEPEIFANINDTDTLAKLV